MTIGEITGHPKAKQCIIPLLLIVIALGSIFVHGYSYGTDDQSFLIPYMQSFHGLWTTDPFVQAFQHLPSPFDRLIAFLPPVWYPELLLFLYLGTTFGSAVALYLLGE